MTSDEFGSRYRLLKQIASEGRHGRTFTAEHRGSRRAVLVHFLDEESSLGGESLADLLAMLPARDRSRVLEVTTVDRSPVVVTEVLEGFETLEGWLRSHAVASEHPGPLSEPPPAARDQAGEFTRLFRAEEESAAAPGQPPGVGREPPAPGSFTELFQAQNPIRTPDPFRAPEPIRAPDPIRTPERSPIAQGTPGLGPPPAVADHTAIPPVQLVSVRLPSREKPEPRPPVLTPKFGGEQPSAIPRPEAVPPPKLGAFKLDAPEPAAAPAAPPVMAGTSDFTRQLSRSPQESVADQPAAAAPAPPAPAPQRRSMLVPILLALNLILIVLTGLAVYFALRRG